MIKICPATNNLTTVMTEKSWKSLCTATFKKETAATISGFERTASESFCAKCRGKTLPPKLKIVSPEEMLAPTTNKENQMSTKVNNRGTCDCCGDNNLVLRNNYEKKMCGKCASMYSNVRNYLPIIEMALAQMWPDKYGAGVKQIDDENPGAVKVAVDEKTEEVFKRIAEAVGYGGDDPIELAEQVGILAADNFQLREVREEQGHGLTGAQLAIANQCDQLKDTLLEKNRKYGNSALSPVRLFSKADPVEQIRVRIDDKLSRLQSSHLDDTEDTEMDLAGDLVLLKVAKAGIVES